MKDFNEYAKSNQGPNNGNQNDLMNMVKAVAGKFDGKNQNDLIVAIYKEAKKGKKKGTLTNADIDNFARMLYPILDDEKGKILSKVVEEIKRI